MPGRFDDLGIVGDVLIKDGFPGQRLRVLPRPLAAQALARKPTSGLLVTDSGYFPHAANHGRRRPGGAPEAVVIVCVEGRGCCRVRDRVSEVGPGHALVIPPGVPHVYWAEPREPWTIWWMHLAGRHVADFLSVIAPDGEEAVVELHDTYRAVAAIDDATRFLEQDETVPSLIAAAGQGWSLLAQLAADSVAGARNGTEPIRQAQEYLRRNFRSATSVPEIAQMAGLSPSHFSARFRAATGGGVVEYTKSLRMAHARELLITTSRSVADVAHSVGYSDAFYFSRQFRTAHGCSPSQYRAQYAGEAT